MEKLQKIGKVEAIALFITITINQILLNIPNIVTASCGSGVWLNIIYVTLIGLGLSFLLTKLFSPFSNKDIIDVSFYLGGKALQVIIGILYIVLFLSMCSLSLRYFANNLKIVYFPNSPIVFLSLFYLIPCIVCNKIGLKGISGANLVFVPIILISIIILFSFSSQKFVIQRLFPVFGYGINSTFIIGISNLFALTSFSFLYLLPPCLKDTKDFKTISITSTLFSGIFLLFSIMAALMTFPFIIKSDEISSIYLLTRMIEFGKFFQRTDAIFIFLWILAFLSFLSLALFYILQIFKKITEIKHSKQMINSFTLLILGLSLSIENIAVIRFLSRNVYKYYNFILIFIISFIILILANIKLKKEKKKLGGNS